MSLILAIEPDPRQSTQLADLVRRRVGADLVHAATTEGALAALAKVGDRVPDLVLVPSLLSPQEDAAIAGALRVIAAAANIRMLTIPLLATADEPAKPQGMLARLRGKKRKTAPGGCDPDLFADQISAYLAEAAAERKALREELEDASPPPKPVPPRPPATPPVPEPKYKPLIIQPVVVAPPHVTADAWPRQQADAIRDLAPVSPPLILDTPDLAAVGESVLRPAAGEAAPSPVANPKAVTRPEQSPVHAEDPSAAAIDPLLEAIAAAVAKTPATANKPDTPLLRPEEVKARFFASRTRIAAAQKAATIPQQASSDKPADSPSAPGAAGRPVPQAPAEMPISLQEAQATLPAAPLVVAAPTPQVADPLPQNTLAEVEPAETSQPSPSSLTSADVSPANEPAPTIVAETPAPQVIAAPAEAASSASSDAPAVPVEAVTAEATVDASLTPAAAASSEPAEPAPSKARLGKSRIRIPKQSGVRKATQKGKPQSKPRDERDDVDVDALIAPLLSEIRAKRHAAPKPEPEPAPDPVMAIPPATEDVDPMFFADDAMIVPPPTAQQAERSAWLELVESLRQDIERLKAEKNAADAPTPAAAPQSVVARTVSKIRRPAAPVVQMPPAASRVSRGKPRKPVQDQWGLFDPEQCGFAALLAKLDEISAREEASA